MKKILKRSAALVFTMAITVMTLCSPVQAAGKLTVKDFKTTGKYAKYMNDMYLGFTGTETDSATCAAYLLCVDTARGGSPQTAIKTNRGITLKSSMSLVFSKYGKTSLKSAKSAEFLKYADKGIDGFKWASKKSRQIFKSCKCAVYTFKKYTSYYHLCFFFKNSKVEGIAFWKNYKKKL